MQPSAHKDTFTRDNLPPASSWPDFRFDLPALQYSPRLNAAHELLSGAIAAGHGDRPALMQGDLVWSYDQLDRISNRIANLLIGKYGLVSGGRVLLRGLNTPMMIACWYSVLKAGGVVVATMPLLRAPELSQIVDRAQISIALCADNLLEDLTMACKDRMVEVASFGSPAAELETMLGNAPNDFSPVDTASDDVALLAFTSGTTGNPKITMHFHRDILAVADCFSAQILKPSPDDIFTGSPPIAFTFGLGALVIFPARIGAATALPASPAPKDLLACIKRHKATTLFTAPTAYRALLAQMKKTDISSLHSCVSAGESLPRATYDAWLSASGIELIDGIGTTEMMHIFISSPKGDIRPGATGRTVPGYQACVLGDNGRPAPVGSVGRLAVRGPTGCRYMADPRQTRYVQNGWNITGDMYCMDEDGYFYFIARTDDMIISSGYNIGGPEVENVLNDHAAVSECAVIGTPDEARGQLVTAFIVLAAGHQGDESLKQQLQAHVKATIAPYKYPRIIEFVASLPKTQTGKIQRYRLRAAQQ